MRSYETRGTHTMRGAGREVRLGHIDRGAQSELEISADLIRRGFAVFRNQSPQGPVDMVAMSPFNGMVLKIQATTATRSASKRVTNYNRHRGDRHWDVLAVRFPDEIRYYKRSGVQINPKSRGARSLLEAPRFRQGLIRPRDDPDDDPSRRRYLIALATRELGPGASPLARRQAIRQAIADYNAEKVSDQREKALREMEHPTPSYAVPVEAGSWKPLEDLRLRAEIERRFNQVAVEQSEQPPIRDLVLPVKSL